MVSNASAFGSSINSATLCFFSSSPKSSKVISAATDSVKEGKLGCSHTCANEVISSGYTTSQKRSSLRTPIFKKGSTLPRYLVHPWLYTILSSFQSIYYL